MSDGAAAEPGREAEAASGDGAPGQTGPTSPPPSASEPTAAGPSTGPATSERATPLGRGRRGAFTAAALVCVVAGVAASVLGARALAQSEANDARQAFPRSSAQIESSLALSIEHEEDLVIAASTFFASNPTATAPRFAAWVHWARTLRRYPELHRLGFVALVRAPELSAFETRLAGGPPKPAGAHQAPTRAGVASAPARPYYCLASAELARGAVLTTPARSNRCALAPALIATRDSAHNLYTASGSGSSPALEVEAPVYRGNQPPPGFAARRAAFAGWLRAVWTPGSVLTQALAAHPQYAVHLRQRSGSSSVTFTSGAPQRGAQTTTSSLLAGWTVRTFGPPAPSADVFANTGAMVLLIGGVLVSVLAGLLLFVLSFTGARDAVSAPPALPQEDLYDTLTGLPNRALLIDRAERMLARAGRLSDSLVGALYIDIDWFRDINEKLGRAAGDQLLAIVAERLEHVVRTHDTVGRLEGDKFVVLVESAARTMRLDSLARRVMEVLHEPIELEGFGPSFSLTVSIGVAFGRYATPDELLHDAEEAMHSAEAAGRDRYTMYNANMRSVIEGRGVMELELNAALQEDRLFLLYQPIFDLTSRRVVGLEALVRWQHPTRGVLSGEDFLPLAEETGLIVPLGRWALEQACSRAAAWNVAARRGGVFIRVSANQLNRDGFVTDVRRALQQSGVDPALLTLEVSEATVMRDLTASAGELEQLKQLGVRVALDDLDGEYAHHAELHRLPLDFLKVDRRSLAASADDDYRNWLLKGIVIIGQDRSLPVIATGVETHEQLASLHAAGCAMAQGPFTGTPSPAEEAERLFELAFPAAVASAPQAESR